MSTPGPDDPESTTPPPPELGGLDPQGLLQAGLETVPPITLPPQPPDPDATLPVQRPASTQPAPAQPELPLPGELTVLLPGGNYHVESFLGQGGMGAVYKGTQVRLKRPVAIKIMRRDFGKDYDFEARFEREAQAMAKLNHPNIVSVIDYGEAGPDYLYIVMELVDGADMMDVIRTGRMTQEMALILLPQICDALQFAHDHGIVHRDIKPSNIMLTRDGRIKMADFGLAKRYDVESSFRTQTGTGMGTPDYAAPEQFDPKANIDHRADIYALGVMIYQMITGQLPRGVWKPPSQRAAIAPQWDDIVAHAMQNDPADRYQQASEIKTDVSQITPRSTDIPVRDQTPPPHSGASQNTDRNVRATSKSRAPAIAAALAILAVLGVVAFFAVRKPPQSGPLSPLNGTSGANTPEPAQGTVRTTIGSAPQAPVLPTSTSSTKFPPGQWVKLFTQPEDLPADLRKPDSGVKWEDGWIDFSQKRSLTLGFASMLNYGIRARFSRRTASNDPGRIVLRDAGGSREYLLGMSGPEFACQKLEQGKYPKLFRTHVTGHVRQNDSYTLEFAAVGTRLIGRYDNEIVQTVSDTSSANGMAYLRGSEPVRDIEVINLDGLPEAEALRLLGVDEQGKDLRGKSTASPAAAPTQNASGEVWEDLIKAGGWDAPWKIENGILTRPLKTKVERKWTSTPVKDGALRITRRWDAAWYDLHMMMRLRGPRLVNLQFPEPKDNKIAVLLTVERATGKSNVTGMTKKSYQRGDIITIEFRAVGENLTVSIDGETVATARDEAPIAGSYAIVSDYSDAPAIHRVEFLNLDGKTTGASATASSSALPVSSSPSSATKEAPFINTLGMKFVPVPITGGPTDGKTVLFSVWETRVQDYEAFVKETKRVWPKPDFEQGPTHPAVNVNWEDATAFCVWLTDKERKTGKLAATEVYRLPSDHEWSCAVGIGDKEDVARAPEAKGRENADVFPWGRAWPPPAGVGNYKGTEFPPPINTPLWGLSSYTDPFVWTAPAGAYHPNAHGLHDLSGNVWEWCLEHFAAEPAKHVRRGGSFNTGIKDYLYSSARGGEREISHGGLSWGFRCVLAPVTE